MHIVNCVDRYKFKVNSDGIPGISNTTDLEYGVTKYAALVQPNVYYGDFIRLDKASSKGTALYKSATPENSSSMTPKSVISIFGYPRWVRL